VTGRSNRGTSTRYIFWSLVLRDGNTVRGHANSCPHVGSPLDWAPDRFIALDGFHLLCGTHGALFRPQDGYCVSRPCATDGRFGQADRGRPGVRRVMDQRLYG